MKPNEIVCGRIGLQLHIEKGSVAASEMVAKAAELTMGLGAGRARRPRVCGIHLPPLWIWQE